MSNWGWEVAVRLLKIIGTCGAFIMCSLRSRIKAVRALVSSLMRVQECGKDRP